MLSNDGNFADMLELCAMIFDARFTKDCKHFLRVDVKFAWRAAIGNGWYNH